MASSTQSSSCVWVWLVSMVLSRRHSPSVIIIIEILMSLLEVMPVLSRWCSTKPANRKGLMTKCWGKKGTGNACSLRPLDWQTPCRIRENLLVSEWHEVRRRVCGSWSPGGWARRTTVDVHLVWCLEKRSRTWAHSVNNHSPSSIT